MLAATAGPRQVQATGARALQQTMAAVPPLDQTIVVSSSWSVSTAPSRGHRVHDHPELAQADLDDVTTQLRRDFSARPAAPGPAVGGLVRHEPRPVRVLTSLPSLERIPAKLEVAYRYPLAGNLRLVAGRMPDTAPPPTSTRTQEIYHLQVVVTPQTARRFGLRPGSRLPIGGPTDAMLAGS